MPSTFDRQPQYRVGVPGQEEDLVRDGVISLEQAREACGVILDEQTLELDEEETERLRSL